jgi:FkbM family methyltransferase
MTLISKAKIAGHGLLRHVMNRKGVTPKVYRRLGYRFLLDGRSSVDRKIIVMNRWEPKQMDYLTKAVECFRGRENPLFLDIGAYFGVYSFLMLKTRIFGRIVAFEADSHNFAQLQANMFLNHATHAISAQNLAVSDRDGTVHILDSTQHPLGNRGGTSMASPDHEGRKFETKAITIDSHLNLRGAWLAIKIDIEGHEPAALKGMEQTLRENRVVMQVEAYAGTEKEVFDLLQTYGMRHLKTIDYDHYFTNISEFELSKNLIADAS